MDCRQRSLERDLRDSVEVSIHCALSISEDIAEHLSGRNQICFFRSNLIRVLTLNPLQALIVGDTPPEDVTSASAAALMSKIPPPHFCSTVLRLIALHVISFGEGYSLENVLGGQNMFTNQTRTENALLNLLIPLFLRVGTGRKGITASHTLRIICVNLEYFQMCQN